MSRFFGLFSKDSNCELRIMNGTSSNLKDVLGNAAKNVTIVKGDTVVSLRTKEDQVVGRAVFEKLITAGWSAYAVSLEGKTKDRVTDFGEILDEEKVIMFGPVAGG